MSQPKFQLDTFRAWAGKSSDISYYLNSHHIDVHCWINEGDGRRQQR
jgi:D-galacturonate reductase